jgi:hypothetical protein
MTAWFNPARWLLLGALLSALVVGYTRLAYHHRAAGYALAQAEYTAVALAAEQAARATEQALQAKIQKAQDDALARQKTLQAAAAAARSAADGLRLDLEALRHSLPGDSTGASPERASTAGVLLGECAGAYSELAGQADQHYSDTLTLRAAWPK